jgi:hypothetical protein
MDSQDGNYTCKTCNKKYSCYKSLWNHNKKFHNNDSTKITQITQKSTNIPQKTTKNDEATCDFCHKTFSRNDSLKRHKQKCKKKTDMFTLEEMQKKIIELEDKIKTTHNTTNNTTNNNNGTINNINIVGFGKEDLSVLTQREKKHILGKGSSGILKLIEKIHFNKNLPQYQNIQITNLRDNYAKVYDEDINDFKISKRTETIHKLMNNKGDNLGDMLEELEDPQNCYHKGVKNFLDILYNYSPNMEDKESLDFYNYMYKEIVILIYNKTKEYSNL